MWRIPDKKWIAGFCLWYRPRDSLPRIARASPGVGSVLRAGYLEERLRSSKAQCIEALGTAKAGAVASLRSRCLCRGTGYADEGTEWNDALIKMGIKEDDRVHKEKTSWVSGEEVERAEHEVALALCWCHECPFASDSMSAPAGWGYPGRVGRAGRR